MVKLGQITVTAYGCVRGPASSLLGEAGAAAAARGGADAEGLATKVPPRAAGADAAAVKAAFGATAERGHSFPSSFHKHR